MSRSVNETLGRTLILLSAAAILAAGGPALADVVNGDFESGGSNWTDTSSAPGLGVTYPPVGGSDGGGYAEMSSDHNNLGGQVCIQQTFDCGDPASGTECTIGIDYKLVPVDAVPGSARLVVEIDGHTNVITDVDTPDWESVSYVVPCGTHTISICLVVDPANNAWIASVDNIRAVCTGGVAEVRNSWSGLKALYR